MGRISDSGFVSKLFDGVVTVVADSALTLLNANEAFCICCGISPDSIAKKSVSLSDLFHDDVIARLSNCFSDSPLSFECNRLSLKNPEKFPVSLHVTAVRIDGVLYDDCLPVYHLVFSDQPDVHELKRMIEFEKHKQDILSTLSEDITFEYDFASDTMCFTDKYKTVFGSNPVICQFRERLDKHEFIDSLTENFRDQFSGMQVHSGESCQARVETHDNQYKWFSLYCSQIPNETGQPVKAIGIIRDIDIQKKEQLLLLDKSRVDSMTGLLNKTTTEELVRDAIVRATPDNMGVLMMIDIDLFKNVNDTLGHLAGDEVIMQIASQLRRAFRERDIIGRVGGDEFHVYMQDVKDTGFVREKAQALCESIEKLFENHEQNFAITVSIGVAFTEEGKSYNELFRQADIALYNAKANGRNQSFFYGQMLNETGVAKHEKTSLTIGAVREGILVDIIDVLFSTPDIRQGVDKVLEFIGHAFNIGKVRVIEMSLDLTTLSVTHEWAAQKEWLNKHLYQNYPISEIIVPEAQDTNGIYYCSDTTLLSEEQRAFLKGEPVVSHLQCNIVQDEKIIGYISFEDRNQKRIWTQQEINALILMSKLISEIIRQQQSLSLLHHSYSSTRSILNGIQGVFIYVVDENGNILYYNDSAATCFKELKETKGNPFTEGLERLQPGVFCPVDVLKEKGQYSTVVNDTPFGSSMNVSVSHILWENREWAYIVLLSEHTQSSEEREQQKKKNTYIAALCNTCDHIVDIDLDTGIYDILAQSKTFNNYELPVIEDYQRSLEIVATTYVVKPLQRPFLNKFSLPEMKKAFADGANNISMEYELQEKADGKPVWKEQTAFLHQLEDGSEHILFYVRDVTEKKLDEARRKEEENNFILALQSNYSEIFHIDLDKGLISPLYYNSAQLPISDSMDYMEYVHQRAANRLHPDSVEPVFAFYNLEHLRKLSIAGEAAELEYRKRQIDEGSYQWIVATLRPVEGNRNRVLLFLRDVTDLKTMEKTVRGLEMRYHALFRLSYDVSTEVNLETGRYSRTFFLQEKTDTFDTGDYSCDFVKFLEMVHPDDRRKVRDRRSMDALRQATENGENDMICEYRVSYNNEYIWIFSRVFFLVEDDIVTAFILARNITAQKKVEEERNMDAQRFNLAIRNTYSEIYEIDLEKNSCKLTYDNHHVLIPAQENHDLNRFAEQYVHPDDRGIFREAIFGNALSREFRSGKNEIHGEYRRLGIDGRWHWVSAIIVPIYASYDMHPQKGLCFVRDISEKKWQEQQQRVNEQYDQALRQIYDELYEVNVSTNTYRIVYHAEGKYQVPDVSGELNRTILQVAHDMIHPEDYQRFLEFLDVGNMRKSFENGQDYRIAEFRKIWLDGTFHWASLTVFPLSSKIGGDEMYLVFIMDIDDRKRAEELAQHNVFLEKQRFADERYKTIVEQTNTLVFEWVVDSGERFISPEIPKRFAGDYDGRDIIQIWRDDKIIHPDDMVMFRQFLDGIRKQNHVEMVARFKKREGDFAWNRVTLSCLYENGKPTRYIGTINDVDDATRSVHALKYRAEYDVLTGIYNMQAFYDKASQMMKASPDRQYHILRLDIDRFKVVNDLYGLEEGDRLLKTIAGLLSDRMKDNAVYGRINGDIFCACVTYSRKEIIDFVQDIAEKLAQYPLASRVIPSFGICRVDNVQTPINVLCDWANLALKTVKGSFYPLYAFYDETLRSQILSEKKIESEMDLALLRKEFLMYLQPKVDIASSRIIGAEGLVRWNHPEEGLIPPDRFVPLFEKNGFIIQMDEYIWEQACICLRRWLEQGLEAVPISVNVSRMHIHDSDLSEKLFRLIKKYDLPPQLLELELTESIFFENEELLVETIRNLQKDGFCISLDDFGAGYSSLNMLKSLSIETIKLDRGFFNEVIVTQRGKTVVAHTISLAKALNINIIAEGVENEEQAEFLLNAGCPYAQGYYYSTPVPIEKFEELAFRKHYLLQED